MTEHRSVAGSNKHCLRPISARATRDADTLNDCYHPYTQAVCCTPSLFIYNGSPSLIAKETVYGNAGQHQMQQLCRFSFGNLTAKEAAILLLVLSIR